MICTSRKLAGFALAGALLFAAATTEARAGFTVTLDTTSGSGPYTYSYSATIAADDTVTNGDFFRIYDFAGYVAGSITAPAGFTAAVANSNSTPPPNVILSHGDDPSLANLTFTYTGATSLSPTQVAALAFTAQSTIAGTSLTNKDFVGQDTKAIGDAAGTKVGSVGDVRVPAVPEPSAMISSALGMLMLGSAYGYRSRRKAAAIA